MSDDPGVVRAANVFVSAVAVAAWTGNVAIVLGRGDSLSSSDLTLLLGATALGAAVMQLMVVVQGAFGRRPASGPVESYPVALPSLMLGSAVLIGLGDSDSISVAVMAFTAFAAGFALTARPPAAVENQPAGVA